MKKIYALGAVAMALLTTGCSNDLTNNDSGIDNTGKERILFSAGDDGQSSVVTRAGFTAQTRIVARIVSEKRGGGAAKCVRTVLTGKADENNSKGYSDVAYAVSSSTPGYTRYWDDAYGRSSILSVYAVAIPNMETKTVSGEDKDILTDDVLKGSSTWATDYAGDNTIEWGVTATQTTNILAEEDLTYSNNIQAGNVGAPSVFTWDYSAGKYPDPTWDGTNNKMNAIKHTYTDAESQTVTDGRLYFTQATAEGNAANGIKEPLSDAPGHFDRGHMDFKHSLTRIQVNLIKGDGFESPALFNVTAMQLLGQSLSGTFDIKTAAWSDKGTATAVNMAKWSSPATSKAATYEAQVLPGYTFEADATNVLQLTVDGNTYYITNQMLRTALTDKPGVNANFSTDMGVRYIFDVTVKKAKIEKITATIVPWNEVNAEEFEIDNSHLTFSFYKNGTACTDVKLYKFEQTLDKVYTDDSYTANPAAGSAYTAVAGFSRVGETNTYTTSEYYKDNKTAYHFRSTNAATALAADGKSFTMTSGSTDYHWGAPMNTSVSTEKLPYSLDNGYLSSIAKGIVAAKQESEINLTEIHMMSQLVIKLTSNPLAGQTDAAKVTLADATVKLTKFSKTGTVDMGSGKITPGTVVSPDDVLTVVKEGETNVYSCTINVVPQTLVRGSKDDDYVGITIKTTDNNEYYIVKRLSEIIATSTGSEVTNMQTDNDYITRWYPGHKYIYTFNITKKQIDVITATIVPWNTVTAGNTELDLEK